MSIFPHDQLARQRRELASTTARHRSMPELDPILGLEVIRRAIGVSKSTFYTEVSPTLPVITLSPRRRGVRRSDLEAWLAARTEQPLVINPDTAEA